MFNQKELMLLQNCFLFKNEGKEYLLQLAEDPLCTVSYFEKRDVIFGDEEHRGMLGMLLSGKATALCTDSGKSSIKIFKSGELFGAAGVFCDNFSQPFGKIEALSSCRVLFVGRQKIEQILCENPERAIEYICFLSGRVEFLNRRISTFTSKEALVRVARYILENTDGTGICKGLNFSALAKSLDISRASLYRARNELVNLKAISVENKTVTVLSREALENIN